MKSVNSVDSDEKIIIVGVPQGSILRPILDFRTLSL